MSFKDDWQPSTRKEREPDHRPKPRSAFNCTSYLLIFYFEPSNADKARADCISRQVLGWLLKCLKMARLYREQKSLFVSHANGIFLIFCLEYGPNTCATLNVEPLVKFEIYFHVQYIPVFAVGHWQHWLSELWIEVGMETILHKTTSLGVKEHVNLFWPVFDFPCRIECVLCENRKDQDNFGNPKI